MYVMEKPSMCSMDMKFDLAFDIMYEKFAIQMQTKLSIRHSQSVFKSVRSTHIYLKPSTYIN